MNHRTEQRHRHWKVEVPVGSRTVKLSGLFGGPHWLSTRNKARGRGIYLDRLWRDYLKRAEDGRQWIFSWPDRSTVPPQMVHQLVKYIKLKLDAGETPEIACLGGHGRTGTLYACLLVNVEGLLPRKAIEQVWLRYCGAALETLGQLRLVHNYYYWLRRNGNGTI